MAHFQTTSFLSSQEGTEVRGWITCLEHDADDHDNEGKTETTLHQHSQQGTTQDKFNVQNQEAKV